MDMPSWARRIDLDFAVELKYFFKGQAVESLERFMDYVQPILDLLERAAETGKQWAGILIAEIRKILGLGSGCQGSTRGGDVEMVDMAVEEHFPSE